MRLTARVVAQEIEAFNCFKATSDPYGFMIEGYFLDGLGGHDQWRIRSGGGIAGQSYTWRFVTKRGDWSSRRVTTRRQLRSLFREFLAGFYDRPLERPGYITYAKENTNGEWIWVQRRRKR